MESSKCIGSEVFCKDRGRYPFLDTVQPTSLAASRLKFKFDLTQKSRHSSHHHLFVGLDGSSIVFDTFLSLKHLKYELMDLYSATVPRVSKEP